MAYTTQDLVNKLSSAANLANDIKGVESTKFAITQNGNDLYLSITGDRWSPNCSMKLPQFLTADDANAFAVSISTKFAEAVGTAVAAKKASVKQALMDIAASL